MLQPAWMLSIRSRMNISRGLLHPSDWEILNALRNGEITVASEEPFTFSSEL